MKKFLRVSFALLLLPTLLLIGCSGSSTSTSPVSGNARIEGQVVADAGLDFAKTASKSLRDADDAPGPVYPVSGATVELLRNGSVIATTTTDEYGRFQFSGLAAGVYDVRVVSGGEAVAHYHAVVAADQSLTIYGRVIDGEYLWDGEYGPGPHWDDMPQGPHWGEGFQGAAPGPGYWHDGQQWCDPQGTPQGTGPHGPGGGPHHQAL